LIATEVARAFIPHLFHAIPDLLPDRTWSG